MLIIPLVEPVMLPLPDGADDPELLEDCPDIDVGMPNRPIMVSYTGIFCSAAIVIAQTAKCDTT